MFQYSYVKAVNSSRLQLEIEAAGLTGILQINTSGSNLFIIFDTSLTLQQKTLLDSVVSAHILKTQREIIEEKISEAIAFGAHLMRQFVSENVELGITQLRLTGHVRKTLREVKDALDTGSIYDSITEIKNIDPEALDAQILTPARILAFRNKIEDWLEVPRATTWNEPETWL